ncbi:hypothetical protein AXK11_03200 [Cephaloticoccus primus]|uniref:Helix-turn-helix domain-containing protein n=1 Tax=Cephaloticoccus primus TaxID=1548207 RepID=A0A139SQK4_9BACT|nr:helix-turn-helix domain-containing protein [Cephaloticoccus primus]KXU36817.1 hypothetical protein AXK11_03200 [Cephaloticoccus primus]
MLTAQIAKPAASSTATSRKLRPAPKRPQPDLAKETLSVAEAARLLDQEEWILRSLCRHGSIPSHEVNGERYITLSDFTAYRRRRQARFDHWDRSPALKALDEVTDALIKQGLYWEAPPEAMAQSSGDR